MVTQPTYRPLTSADASAAADVIAQAFVDDPLCAFMLPARASRIGTLRTFFRAYASLNIQNGRGYGIGDPLQGVAFWKAPDQADLSVRLSALAEWIPLLFTPYPFGYWRARAVLRRIDDLHARHASAPHFYLDNLGVLASARGQGLASRLIRPFLEHADARRVSVYTDTVTHANVALYQHFGFECVEASAVPGTGLTVYALRRAAV